MSRCKHGMIADQCGICLGQVTRENQTCIYGGHEREPGIDPMARKPIGAVRMSYVPDREITVTERALTRVEQNEVEQEDQESMKKSLPVMTEEAVEKHLAKAGNGWIELETRERPTCPRCKKNDAMIRKNGTAYPCKECYGKALSDGHKKAKVQSLPKQAQNIPDRSSKKVKSPVKEFDIATASPGEFMDFLQGKLREHVSEAREIHQLMMSMNRIFNMGYEIKALSLVGMETKSPSLEEGRG